MRAPDKNKSKGRDVVRHGRFILAIACAAASSLLSAAGSQAQTPIRVGFMTVKTGPLAAIGLQMEVGLLQLLKERNNTLAGRKVELYTVDSAATPAIAKTKLQELIQRDKVHVVIGPLAAFEALAIDDQIREAKMPIISSSAAAEDLTQRKFNPWFVRATATSAQSSHPLGEYAAKVLGYKRMAIFADDFAYTQEVSSGFQRVFEDNGGKIVQKLWTPINAPDYAPYLAQIKKDVDGIFLGSAGSNSLRFLRQQVEFGLKIPVLGAQTVTDEAILRNMGDEALGVVTTRWYSATIDTPANKKFVAEHVRANGYEPGTFSAGGYSAGLFLEQGLIDAKGNIEDKEEFMRRLRTMTLTTDPRGQLRFDEYGNPIQTIFITKVERIGGKLVNSVVATYPDVSQFWKYDPKEFLANPVYSRNWPPARYLE